MKWLIFLTVFCPLLQGCMGIAFLKPQTVIINDPIISPYHSRADSVQERRPAKETNPVTYTSVWLRANWGDPDITGHAADSSTVWTYKFRPIWAGVVPFVIVPIPLALPVEKQKVSFVLRDGRVVGARVVKARMSGGLAGFIPSPEGSGHFGAISLDPDAPH